jgi:hypothetical protein
MVNRSGAEKRKNKLARQIAALIDPEIEADDEPSDELHEEDEGPPVGIRPPPPPPPPAPPDAAHHKKRKWRGDAVNPQVANQQQKAQREIEQQKKQALKEHLPPTIATSYC